MRKQKKAKCNDHLNHRFSLYQFRKPVRDQFSGVWLAAEHNSSPPPSIIALTSIGTQAELEIENAMRRSLTPEEKENKSLKSM